MIGATVPPLVGAGGLESGADTGTQQESATYGNTIAKLFRVSCVPCHRSEGIAPFSLTSYAEVKRNAELVRTQVLLRSMPPPEPRSEFGGFKHARALTNDELITVQRWFQAGMPEGEKIETVLPPISKRVTAASAKFFVSRRETVRKEGPRYWKSYVFDPGSLPNIQSWSFSPADSKPFRSVIVAIAQDRDLKAGTSKETGGIVTYKRGKVIGAWAPGYPRWTLPKDQAIPIPKDSKIVVQVLYQPLGREANGGFRFSAYGAAHMAKEPRAVVLERPSFVIAAYTNPIYELEHIVSQDSRLLSLIPEARFYASKIELTAKFPTGENKTILDAFRWDPYWIGNYTFRKPITLPTGTTLTARFYYSNDESCPNNAGKVPQPVASGPRIEDEFCRMTLWLISASK